MLSSGTLRLNLSYILLVLFCFTTSCRKAEILETTTIFIGHKGSGSNNYNDVVIENTLPAVQNIFGKLDGAELDIQMSLDETPWIWHNSSLDGFVCGSSSQDTIPKMRDIDIEKIRICHRSKSDRIYKLSEVVNWSNSTPSGIYLSLDIKTSFSRATFDLYGSRDNYFTTLASSIAKVFENYKFSEKTIAEVDSKIFCQTLKSFPSTRKIGTYFMRYEPMDRKIQNAVALGYDGLSCNYTDPTVTSESIAAAHAAGLKVQLWTPYYLDELRFALDMNPDFIQTDNIYAKKGLNIK